MADFDSVTDCLADLPEIVSEELDDCLVYGDARTVPLSRIQTLGGQFLSRNWVTIPHVTHHDDIDISAIEDWRQTVSGAEIRPALPVILAKALVVVLREFPKFNASLCADHSALILKDYFNIGVAVNTEQGLLVPVLKNVDKRSVTELSEELAGLADAARNKGLPMEKMSGHSFTISSIGHLGGTGFTPIINAPDVAILGVTRAFWKPHRGEADAVLWRRCLPLSLSYDHRVINGADAARFLSRLGEVCAEPELFCD